MRDPKTTQHPARGIWRALASILDEIIDRPVRRWLRSRTREPGIKQGHRSRLWPPATGLTARPAI